MLFGGGGGWLHALVLAIHTAVVDGVGCFWPVLRFCHLWSLFGALGYARVSILSLLIISWSRAGVDACHALDVGDDRGFLTPKVALLLLLFVVVPIAAFHGHGQRRL